MNATATVSFVWNISVHFEFFQVDVLFIIYVLFRKTQAPNTVKGNRYFYKATGVAWATISDLMHDIDLVTMTGIITDRVMKDTFLSVGCCIAERLSPRGKLKDSPPSLPPTDHIYYLPLGLLFIQEATQKNKLSK